MSQTTCKNCSNLIPVEATFCPHCGTSVSVPTPEPVTQVPNGNNAVQQAAASFDALQQSKFLVLFNGFINNMDQSGFLRKPLYWLYIVFAVLNILVPVYLLFAIISNDLLDNIGFGILVLWLVFAFAGWMGFQLWWNRKDRIGRYYSENDEFYAIPLFSHYIQTIGEWLGITITIIGAGGSLVVWIFLKDAGRGIPDFPLPLGSMGIAAVIIAPVLGFIIIMITRVGAELYRALAAIANNTKVISLKK